MDLPIYTACIIKMKVGDPWWPNWTLVSKQENNGKPCHPWCFSNLISSSFAGYSSPFFETTRFAASGNGKRWTPRNKHKSWRNKDSFSFFSQDFCLYRWFISTMMPWIMKNMKMSKKTQDPPKSSNKHGQYMSIQLPHASQRSSKQFSRVQLPSGSTALAGFSHRSVCVCVCVCVCKEWWTKAFPYRGGMMRR